MKIGILLYPFGEKMPAGLGAYVLNLTMELITERKDWHFYLFTKGSHNTHMFDVFDNVTIKPMADNFLWKDSAYLQNRHVDVWLYNNPNLPLFCTPKRSLVTALDFGIFYPKNAFKVRDVIQKSIMKYAQYSSLRRTSHVACTSFATKKDLHTFFPAIPDEKVSVVMCGYTKICEVYTADEKIRFPKNYYLLIGVIKQRKNQLTAVRAFILAKEMGLKGKLLICGKGKGDYFDTVMKTIRETPYKDDIVYLGYRTNEELVTLFTHTRALIFPSHVEGFGMPVLEAMSCGTPVIASSNGAIGEAAGGAAILSDSSDIHGFRDALLMMEDDSIRNEYIEKGNIRAREFSWKRSAREYGALFERLVRE